MWEHNYNSKDRNTILTIHNFKKPIAKNKFKFYYDFNTDLPI